MFYFIKKVYNINNIFVIILSIKNEKKTYIKGKFIYIKKK